MKSRHLFAAVLCLAFLLFALPAEAKHHLTVGMQEGALALESVGPMAFGPDGILFVSDPKGAAIFAIATGDQESSKSSGGLKVEGIDKKIAALLGSSPQGVQIRDLAVNPASGNAYLAVSRGGTPVLLKVHRDGKIKTLPTEKVKFSKAKHKPPC